MIEPDAELDRLLAHIDEAAPVRAEVADRIRRRVDDRRRIRRRVGLASAAAVLAVALIAAVAVLRAEPDAGEEVATQADPRELELEDACAAYREVAAAPIELRAGLTDASTTVDDLERAIAALADVAGAASVLVDGPADVAAIDGGFRQARQALVGGDLDDAHGSFSFAIDRYRRSALADRRCLG